MKKAFPKAKVTGKFSIYGHEVRTGRGEGQEMAEGAEIKLISVFQEESAIQAKAWVADYACISQNFRSFAEKLFLCHNEPVNQTFLNLTCLVYKQSSPTRL